MSVLTLLKAWQIFLFLLLLLALAPLCLQAQASPELPGAAANALGNASVTLSNAWALQNNIGALAGLEESTLAFGYNTRFKLQELTTIGFMAALPLKQLLGEQLLKKKMGLHRGVLGASLSRFGMGAYSIQEIGLGYSHRISYMSLGLKANYLQHSIEGLDSQRAFVLEAGGKAELIPALHFAAHAYNLNQSRFADHNQEYLPILLKAGLAYLPAKHIQLLVQTLKDLEQPARFSFGMEYGLLSSLYLRTGFMSRPSDAAFGLGFHSGNFVFDYAFQHQQYIGARHHLSFSIVIKPNKPNL